MPVNEEKMFILKMLEEGKITGDEAAKLLEALEGGSKHSAGENTARQHQHKQDNFQDEIFKMRQRVNDWRKEFKSNYNQKDFDRMIDEFSTKAEKVGKNLATTTFGLVDRMVDFVGSFVDTHAFNMFGSYKVIDKTFEAVAFEGMEIDIEGSNGHIVVKKHLDNKVIIKSRVRSPQDNADAILAFKDSGSSVEMKVNKIGNVSVSHEIFLPAVKFKKVKLETTNSKIYVEDSLCEEFEAITKNGHIELMGVTGDKVNVNTKNAKIQLNYVIGKEITINTSNSVIDVKHIKAEKAKAITTNGRIFVENAQNYENSNELELQLKTTNGGIKVNMNDMDNRGYKVKAHTTNSGVNLLIPNLTYHSINKQGIGGSFVEAESSGYDNFPEKVAIYAETVNGFIEVVK